MMFTKFFTILSLLVVLCTQAIAHNYGGTKADGGHHFIQTADGGYIICGVFGDSLPLLHTKLFIIKTDVNGNMQWIKTYGKDSSDNSANSISQTSDGGFIVIGTEDLPIGKSNAWLLRLSEDGDSLWSRVYDPDEWNNFGAFSYVKPDGNYVIGIGGDGLLWQNPWHLYETDTSGAILDSVILNPSGWGGPSGIFPTTDGGFVAASTNFMAIDAIRAVKIDSNFQTTFDNTFIDFTGAGLYDAHAICESKDGGYFVAGETNFYNSSGFFEFYIMKLDANGDSLWSKHFGDTLIHNSLACIRALPDSGFLVAGRSDSAMIFRFDKNGNQIWAHSFGPSTSLWINFMELNQQGGFTLLGDTIDAYGYTNVWFASTDTAGNILTSTTYNLTATHAINVFPNPTTDLANITFTLSSQEHVRIEIFDSKGACCQTICDQVMSAGMHTVSTSGVLAPGIYYVSLRTAASFTANSLIIIE